MLKYGVVLATVAMVVEGQFQGSSFVKLSHKDVTFNENVTFVSQARSRIECGLQCVRHQECVAFTLTKESDKGGTCRGHFFDKTESSAVTSVPGTVAYRLAIDYCASGPCQHGGTCIKGVNSYTCNCQTCFSGNNCQISPINDGGNWTVFQRRQDGSVDFYRNWTQYQQGFGNPAGEFWLGLDALHTLTSQGRYELRVDVMKWDCIAGYATYSNFTVAGSSDFYRIHFDSFTGGNAGDCLSYHNNMQFSTLGAKHDLQTWDCAEACHGAWWYNACFYSNLNGLYKQGGSDPDGNGLCWHTFKAWNDSMKFTEMKFRPMA